MQKHSDIQLLTINAGSSSLKFSVFQAGDSWPCLLTGKFERIGLSGGELSFQTFASEKKSSRKLDLPNHAACLPPLLEVLKEIGKPIRAIGHRVVHGGPNFTEAQKVTNEMLAELRRLSPFDPEHLPAAIGLIEEFGKHFPDLPQVACFDTAFHRNMPRVAKLLPLPRRYDTAGVRRYGFHGLSYTYLMQQLTAIENGKPAKGRIILAHLGNGASMAAVKDGTGIDTTMGFTPTAGLVMGTRTGDLDPGVVAYLARTEGMTLKQFNEMVNKTSGMLGVSETSSDTRDLLQSEATDVRAAEALALFCYQAKRWIGALVAALNGLNTLVFTGGIGENSAVLRERIAAGLECFGVAIDPKRNHSGLPIISSDNSRVVVRVIPTNEEIVIAQSALAIAFLNKKNTSLSKRKIKIL